MDTSLDIEGFLAEFGSKCVEFGYYFDQFMREEINFGEITRRLSQATAEGEAYYDMHHQSMDSVQAQRYDVMQKTLEGMTTELIEAEIKRNRKIINDALLNGEYFIVNITYNSINSSLYLVYPNESQFAERDRKVGELQQEQELVQALMKVLKALETKVYPTHMYDDDYKMLGKAFQIYVDYFKTVSPSPIKTTCDERVFGLFKGHIDYLESKSFFGDQEKSYGYAQEFVKVLEPLGTEAQIEEMERLLKRIRVLDPEEQLEILRSEALKAEGEANVYSAVVAFNNFMQKHPGLPKVHAYKREIIQEITAKGYS